MPARVDNSDESSGTADTQNPQWSYNNTSPLVIGLITWANINAYRNMASATFNSIAMTRVCVVSSARAYNEFWYLKNAPIGTYQMRWTTQSGDYAGGWIIHNISIGGANMGDPIRTFKVKNQETGSSISDTITGITIGDLVLGCFTHTHGFEVSNAGGGQTEIESTVTGSGAIYEAHSTVSSYTVATGTSEVESASWASSDRRNNMALVAIKAGGGSRGYVVMSKMREFFEDIKRGLVPPDELHNRYRGLKEQGLLTI
jgi:hypothetical protein